jgi:hypothetical protein
MSVAQEDVPTGHTHGPGCCALPLADTPLLSSAASPPCPAVRRACRSPSYASDLRSSAPARTWCAMVLEAPRPDGKPTPTCGCIVSLSDAENGRSVHDHLQRCVGVARHRRVVESSGRPLVVCHGLGPGQVGDVLVKRGVVRRTSLAWSNVRARVGVSCFALPVGSRIGGRGGRTGRGRAGLDGGGRLDSDRGRGTSLSLGVVVVVVVRLRSRWRLVVPVAPILGGRCWLKTKKKGAEQSYVSAKEEDFWHRK